MTALDVRRSAEARWRGQLDQTFGHLLPEAIDSADPARALVGQVSKAVLGLASAFRVRGTPQILRRTDQSLRKAPADPLKICIQKAGHTTLRQGDVTLTIRPGQLALYDTGRPYALRLEGAWSCTVMTLPRAALSLPPSVLTTAMRHPFAADAGPGAVLTHLLESAAGAGPGTTEMTDELRRHLGEAGLNLVAGLVCDQGPTITSDVAGDAVRTAILSHITAHLGDRDLNLESVARAHNMSTRTLYRLFQDQERSVAATIRELRLAHIYRDLADPRQTRRSIMAIAARWGYTDQAVLTRAFRDRFGSTPAAFRRGTLT